MINREVLRRLFQETTFLTRLAGLLLFGYGVGTGLDSVAPWTSFAVGSFLLAMTGLRRHGELDLSHE